MWQRFFDWLRPPAVRDVPALERLIGQFAAEIAHKACVGYCRVKSGPHVRELFKEPAFRQALDACRRDSYAWVLEDVTAAAQSYLRAAEAGSGDAVDAALGALYRRLLEADPLRPDGAADEEAHTGSLRRRLTRGRLAEPVPPAEAGRVSGPKVFASLPIHPRLRREDEEAHANLIRFGLASFGEELERRLDGAAVVADILRRGAP